MDVTYIAHAASLSRLESAYMSSALHPFILFPSFTGLGNTPLLTPLFHVDSLTGIIAGIGGLALRSPIIWTSLKKEGGRWF